MGVEVVDQPHTSAPVIQKLGTCKSASGKAGNVSLMTGIKTLALCLLVMKPPLMGSALNVTKYQHTTA